MENINKVLDSDKHEDLVEYFIYPIFERKPSKEDLKLLLEKINSFVNEVAGEYIWHRDPFNLKKDPKENVFFGSTRFGENVDDEWFIVEILIKLTENFDNLIARVIDNDGEFLLIQAAEFLPKWADSDKSCAQRVYIFAGKIHLISKIDNAQIKLVEDIPEINSAIQFVKSSPEKTIANDDIQKEITEKIERIDRNFHESNIMLPPLLIEILKRRPDFLSFGVQAFHNHDALDLKEAKYMKNFKPSDGLFKTRVRFTRCLYAMLFKKEFRPDHKAGWSVPKSSNEFKENSLGSKLTLGFEILLTQQKRKLPNEPNLNALNDWTKYKESLEKIGYFQNFIENSKPYCELVEKAKEYFETNVKVAIVDDFEGDYELKATHDIEKLIKELDGVIDFSIIELESKNLPPSDDDSWIHFNQEKLDLLLKEQFKIDESASGPIEEIPGKLKEFFKRISDFEGVETAEESNVDWESDLNDTDLDQLEPVDFRADDFVSAMDKLLLDLGNPDKVWDESGDEDGDEFNLDEDCENLALEKEIREKYKFKKDSQIHKLMGDMDKEIAQSDLGKSFKANDNELDSDDDEFNDVESFKPVTVNIDANALSNILKSLQSQDTPAGPSSNLLRSVGFFKQDKK